MKRKGRILLLVLVFMTPHSLSLSTRVLWIIAQPIVGELGPFAVAKQHARLSSAVDDGKQYIPLSCDRYHSQLSIDSRCFLLLPSTTESFIVRSSKAHLIRMHSIYLSAISSTKCSHILPPNRLLSWTIVGSTSTRKFLNSLNPGSLLSSHFPSQNLMQPFSGMRYEFLPPYSLDYNPIELAFSAMKYHLRCKGEYIRMAMMDMPMLETCCVLFEALYQISPADVFGWFRHCSYV